jgi:hypothetical protein
MATFRGAVRGKKPAWSQSAAGMSQVIAQTHNIVDPRSLFAAATA